MTPFSRISPRVARKTCLQASFPNDDLPKHRHSHSTAPLWRVLPRRLPLSRTTTDRPNTWPTILTVRILLSSSRRQQPQDLVLPVRSRLPVVNTTSVRPQLQKHSQMMFDPSRRPLSRMTVRRPKLLPTNSILCPVRILLPLPSRHHVALTRFVIARPVPKTMPAYGNPRAGVLPQEKCLISPSSAQPA